MSTFYFANAGIKILGMSMEEDRWVTNLSIFGFYSPANAIAEVQKHWTNAFALFQYNPAGEILRSGALLNNGVLLLLAVAAYIIGSKRFHRRDLPAPM